jgi:hypothetical protein
MTWWIISTMLIADASLGSSCVTAFHGQRVPTGMCQCRHRVGKHNGKGDCHRDPNHAYARANNEIGVVRK